MRKISALITTLALAACGGSGDKAETSDLGSLEVNTTLATTFLPAVSKVEILALAKGETDETKASIFTLSSLNSKDAAMVLAAGEYQFGVKVYQKIDDKDVILAQSIKGSTECPEVTGTIKGGSKTQIDVAVCTNEVTKPLETNGSGSSSFSVSVRGFLPLLKCTTTPNYSVYKNSFKSLGIEAKVGADNKAVAFRLTVGQQNSSGVIETYSAPLQFEPTTTSSFGMDTKFQVLNQTGEQIGTIFFDTLGSQAWSIELILKDGSGVVHLGNIANAAACTQVIEKSRDFSLQKFFRGE